MLPPESAGGEGSEGSGLARRGAGASRSGSASASQAGGPSASRGGTTSGSGLLWDLGQWLEWSYWRAPQPAHRKPRKGPSGGAGAAAPTGAAAATPGGDSTPRSPAPPAPAPERDANPFLRPLMLSMAQRLLEHAVRRGWCATADVLFSGLLAHGRSCGRAARCTNGKHSLLHLAIASGRWVLLQWLAEGWAPHCRPSGSAQRPLTLGPYACIYL
jgi:hypothetical protein